MQKNAFVVSGKLANTEGAGDLEVTVRVTRDGVEILFEGYGDKCSEPGHGVPILIENCNGVPRVVIWGDITSEDPTHNVTLEGAREKVAS